MFNEPQLEMFHAGFVAGAACPLLMFHAEREQAHPLGVSAFPLTTVENIRSSWQPFAREWRILFGFA